MITRLLYWSLGLPPAINFSGMKPFDNTPPKVVIHKRSIPAAVISLMIAVAIFLLVTQYRILQNTSSAADALVNSFAEFMSEDPLLEITIRWVGFALIVIFLWLIPLAIFLIAAVRSVLETFPSLKNHRDLDAME